MTDTLQPFKRRGRLTDRMLSKAILAPISAGYEPPEALVGHLGISREIPMIRSLYQAHGAASAHQRTPKYLPFYKAIKNKFPSFEWNIHDHLEKPQVTLSKPFINFIRPSLLTLLICCIREKFATTPPLKVRYPSLRELPDDLVSEMGKLFQDLSFSLPEDDYIAAVSQVLLKGLSGEEITLISPVCPDYGFVKTKTKYRYTFDELGGGIGLVAQRILATLPKVQDLFSRYGIKSRLVIAAGDFEGFDEATILRVRETRGDFIAKVKQSQAQVLAALGRPASSVFISELAGGETGWRTLTSRSHESLVGEDFGNLVPSKVDFATILEARLPLYRAWHGERPLSEYAKVLLEQCAEYAAMGLVFHENFSNPLVIGGDHNRMMPFYWLHQQIPVLYLRRAY